VQRLGKNTGGYHGEGIDIQAVLMELKRVAGLTGWHRDTFEISSGAELSAYRRQGTHSSRRLYLSTGIHGDEPAGPLALLELLRRNLWPAHLDIWLCPCLNLTGFPLNRRENADGIDLNRDYRHLATPEIRAHVAWLKTQPTFDLAVCLHEDWEASGYYLYELNPDNRPSLAPQIIKQVARVCPIESGETVDGWPIQDGIIRPNVQPDERLQWPEAIFLITHKTRQSYTLEAPSDFPLELRVRAHITAIESIFNLL
jgi:murein peptide amidase A